MDTKNKDKREYMHSISRVVDRTRQLFKDIERIEFDLKNLKEDVQKTLSAMETFFNDNLKAEKDV